MTSSAFDDRSVISWHRLILSIVSGSALVYLGVMGLKVPLHALTSASALLAVTIPGILFVVASRGVENTGRALFAPFKKSGNTTENAESAGILADLQNCLLVSAIILGASNVCSLRNISGEALGLAVMTSLPGILYSLLISGLLLLPAQQATSPGDPHTRASIAQQFLAVFCLLTAAAFFVFSAALQGVRVSLLFSIPSVLVVCGPVVAVWLCSISFNLIAAQNMAIASIFGGLIGTILASMSQYGASNTDNNIIGIMEVAYAPLIYGLLGGLYFRLCLKNF